MSKEEFHTIEREMEYEYFLKMEEDFFDRPEIIAMEVLPNGDWLVLTYIAVQLESLGKNKVARIIDNEDIENACNTFNLKNKPIKEKIKIFMEALECLYLIKPICQGNYELTKPCDSGYKIKD